MAQTFPYTYYSCSCVDASTSKKFGAQRRSLSQQAEADDNDETFDPRSPRANFSLFPIEHLLYCTECHQMRCPRCTTEEVVCWYCPACLFEVPSSTVRSEGNRCTRSCSNCPICTAYLQVSSLELQSEESRDEGPGGPYILSCPFCQWTTLDIGITFEKPNNICSQLSKIRNGGIVVPSAKEREHAVDKKQRRGSMDEEAEDEADILADAEETFARLNTFYRQQVDDAAESSLYSASSGDMNYASPSSINRLLNMYAMGKRPKARKPKPMRSAKSLTEGLQLCDPHIDESTIAQLQSGSWDSTTSLSQLSLQERDSPRFLDDVRPVATLLKTKRSKRCKTCRTLLSRPEPKVSTTRYKIKVLASTNIPSLTLRSLTSPPTHSKTHPLTTTSGSSNPLRQLRPLIPHQYILTLSNPLFDTVTITLATPATTPGPVQTRVTILCPQFEVGANTDVWDEALNSSSASAVAKRRTGGALGEEGKVPEVGKVWEKGRNWTSVVVEVVPGVLPGTVGAAGGQEEGEGEEKEAEDVDVLEVPVFVRVEYEADGAGGAGGGVGEERKEGVGGAGGREARELAFWCVLGLGRIAA